MQRVYHGLSHTYIAVFVLLWSATVQAAPPQHYTVTDLQAGQASAIEPVTLAVVGSRPVTGLDQAYRLGVGPAGLALGFLPGGVFSTAASIRQGRVVGWSGTGDASLHTHAFVVTLPASGPAPALLDLGTTGDADLASFAADINADGLIVGWGDSPDGQHIVPLLWQPWAPLPSILPTLGQSHGFAMTVNDAGDICGNTDTAAGETHATCWFVGETTPTDLHVGDPTRVSLALTVSESQVVGGLIETAQGTRGFLWTRATGLVLLSPLEGDSASRVQAINMLGEVVGESSHQDEAMVPNHTVSTPVLWRRGQPVDLTTLLEVPADCDLDRAVGIADSGHIVVNGTCGPQETSHAFLLTPEGVTSPAPAPPKRPKRPKPPEVLANAGVQLAKLTPQVLAQIQAAHPELAQKLRDQAARLH